MNYLSEKILSLFLTLLILITAGGSNHQNSSDVTGDAPAATVKFMKCVPTTKQNEPTTNKIEPTTDKPEDRTKVVISAAGDCTLGSDKCYSYKDSFEAFYDKYGYKYFFNDVRKIFMKDDFTVINLECALTNSTKYADKQYVYRGKPEYAKILSYSDVELVSLANNHSHDYLEKGFSDTISALNKESVKYAYYYKIQIMKKGNIKAAFISVDYWNCSKEMLKNYLNKADKLGADLKILSIHWGTNYEQNYDSKQKYFGHLAVDLGADLILGHHPHILQGIEIYKDVPIVYSLGNFCYAGKRNLGNERNTMIFQMEFDFEGKKLDGTKCKIIPTYMSNKNPQNTYRPTIVTSSNEKTKILKQVYSLSKNLK